MYTHWLNLSVRWDGRASGYVKEASERKKIMLHLLAVSILVLSINPSGAPSRAGGKVSGPRVSARPPERYLCPWAVGRGVRLGRREDNIFLCRSGSSSTQDSSDCTSKISKYAKKICEF